LSSPTDTQSDLLQIDDLNDGMQHESTIDSEMNVEKAKFDGSTMTSAADGDQEAVGNNFYCVETSVDFSSESESDDRGNIESLRDSLAEWAMQFNVPKNAVTALLKLLSRYHVDLPQDARTLQRTPRSHVISSLAGGGQYVHFGVQKGIEVLIKSGDITVYLGKLELQFNIDGLPLFKSSNMTLWPILCIVRNTVQETL